MAEAPIAAAEATAARDDAPLDEVMLAMDVVDTLRHTEKLVAQELATDERKRRLKERLRAIYAAQGIEVSDRILDQGVAALEEDRFAYRPSPPGLARSLALLWVKRALWGRWLLIGLGVLLLIGGIHYVAFELPEARQREAAIRERYDLPKAMAAELSRIKAVARDPAVLPAADRLLAAGIAAAKADDLPGARARAAELRALRETLEQTYVLKIVSGPNQRSGVYRIPEINPGARNYYIIVEAIGPDGKALSLPIQSEEDQRVAHVSRWGIRVDEAVYNRIRADKLDDGIIQNDRFGEKRRGFLHPDYAYPVPGGAILEW